MHIKVITRLECLPNTNSSELEASMKLLKELLLFLSGEGGQAEKLAKQGIWLAGNGKEQEAIERFSESLAIKPDDPAVLAQRAISYLALHDSAHALIDINQSLGLRPRNSPTMLTRASIHLLRKNFDDCISDCDEAMSLLAWPQTDRMKQLKDDEGFASLVKFQAHQTAARAHLGLKNFDVALSRCRKALDINPDDVETLELKSVILKAKG